MNREIKLFPSHLKPFAENFELAVRAGRISLMDAMEFVSELENTVLEQRERVHHRLKHDTRRERTPPKEITHG